jgi:hypothetical protein
MRTEIQGRMQNLSHGVFMRTEIHGRMQNLSSWSVHEDRNPW